MPQGPARACWVKCERERKKADRRVQCMSFPRRRPSSIMCQPNPQPSSTLREAVARTPPSARMTSVSRRRPATFLTADCHPNQPRAVVLGSFGLSGGQLEPTSPSAHTTPQNVGLCPSWCKECDSAKQYRIVALCRAAMRSRPMMQLALFPPPAPSIPGV